MITRVLRVVAAIIVMTLSLAIFTGSASAAPYTANGVTISDSSPSPGDTVTVTASGFKPSSEVEVFIFSEGSDRILLATAVADANGQVSVDVVVPATLTPGSQQTIEVSGISPNGSPYAPSVGITLAGGLSDTGFSGGKIAALAIAILAAGVVTLVVVRRGRRVKN